MSKDQKDELFEVCKRLLARLQAETCNVETCDLHPSTDIAMEQARKLIAKIESVTK